MIPLLSFSQITWSWTDAETGLEKGTFVTNGTLNEDGTVSNGAYTISDFTLDQTSTTISTSGTFANGDWVLSQPDIGFNWSEGSVVQFWRSSGNLTNGLNIYTNNWTYRIIMSIDYFAILMEEVDLVFQQSTPVVIPINPVSDPDIKLNGTVSAESNQIKNVADPTDTQDAATKNYVDSNINSFSGSYNDLTDKPTVFNGNLIGDVTGNVTGDVTGTAGRVDVSNTATNQNQYILQANGNLGSKTVFADAGLLFNPVSHLLTVDGSGTFAGDLTVTGNLTGNVTGDVTGNVTGNLTGNLTGNVTGNVTSDILKLNTLTQTEIDAITPEEGMVLYNESKKKIQIYSTSSTSLSNSEFTGQYAPDDSYDRVYGYQNFIAPFTGTIYGISLYLKKKEQEHCCDTMLNFEGNSISIDYYDDTYQNASLNSSFWHEFTFNNPVSVTFGESYSFSVDSRIFDLGINFAYSDGEFYIGTPNNFAEGVDLMFLVSYTVDPNSPVTLSWINLN